jgi:tRNA(Glu) U13 pseudouridine synthase TruD
LRATQALGQGVKSQALAIIENLFAQWFPNFFGTQRFWINWKNWEIWKNILEKKTSIKNKFEEKFKLQAYNSWLFNQYLKDRLPLWKEALEWEVVKDGQVTWPVFGDDTLLAKENTKAWEFQKTFMQKHKINSDFFNFFKKHKIFWIPRPIRVMPTNTYVRYQWDDLLIEFDLPSGSYASIFIHQMLDKLEKVQEKTK